MKFHQAALLSVFSEAQGNNRKQRGVGVEVIINIIRNIFTTTCPHGVASLKPVGAQDSRLPLGPPEHSSVVISERAPL